MSWSPNPSLRPRNVAPKLPKPKRCCWGGRAAKTLAHAVLIVVPKSQVAYPTVWKGDENWPCAVEADGFICQLETPEAAERKA